MSHQHIIVETAGRVGVIRLNRPNALNALNTAMIAEIAAAVDAFEADANIGCMVVTGSDKAFAAGADIKEMATKTYMEAFMYNFAAGWDRIARAQAGDRGSRGLCAGRRLRTRHAVRSHHRRRQCEVRPARDQA